MKKIRCRYDCWHILDHVPVKFGLKKKTKQNKTKRRLDAKNGEPEYNCVNMKEEGETSGCCLGFSFLNKKEESR